MAKILRSRRIFLFYDLFDSAASLALHTTSQLFYYTHDTANKLLEISHLFHSSFFIQPLSLLSFLISDNRNPWSPIPLTQLPLYIYQMIPAEERTTALSILLFPITPPRHILHHSSHDSDLFTLVQHKAVFSTQRLHIVKPHNHTSLTWYLRQTSRRLYHIPLSAFLPVKLFRHVQLTAISAWYLTSAITLN